MRYLFVFDSVRAFFIVFVGECEVLVFDSVRAFFLIVFVGECEVLVCL